MNRVLASASTKYQQTVRPPMRGVARALSLGALVCTMALAGCVDAGLQPLDSTVEAPVWQTGAFWAWNQTTTESSEAKDGSTEGSQEQTVRSTVTHTVADTKRQWNGHDAYWVESEDTAGHGVPVSGETLFAPTDVRVVSKEDLGLLAVGRIRESGFGCDAPHLALHHAFGAVDLLRFPLVDGASWEDELLGSTYVAEVVGRTSVTVPAGTFDAVEVHVSVSLNGSWVDEMVDEHEIMFHDFSSEVRLWYAEAAGHVVRLEGASRSDVEQEDLRMVSEAETTMVLESFSLDAAPAAPLPPSYEHAAPRMPSIERPVIVTESAFPVNVANATARNVTFGVSLDQGSFSNFTGDPVQVDKVTASPRLEEEGLMPRWKLTQGFGRDETVVATATGHVFTPTLPTGGTFRLEIALVPTPGNETADDKAPPDTCVPRAYVRSAAHVSFDAYWEKTFTIAVEEGKPARYPLGIVPVRDEARGISMSWDHESKGTVDDRPEPVLVSPDGDEWSWQHPGPEAGDWSLEWDARGPKAGVAHVPHVFGHEGEVTVRVDYGGSASD